MKDFLWYLLFLDEEEDRVQILRCLKEGDDSILCEVKYKGALYNVWIPKEGFDKKGKLHPWCAKAVAEQIEADE